MRACRIDHPCRRTVSTSTPCHPLQKTFRLRRHDAGITGAARNRVPDQAPAMAFI
jgi:hypothetical protein